MFELKINILLDKKIWIDPILLVDGDNKKEREQDLKVMMKRLEAKYAALQVVPVISKLGSPMVSTICHVRKAT